MVLECMHVRFLECITIWKQRFASLYWLPNHLWNRVGKVAKNILKNPNCEAYVTQHLSTEKNNRLWFSSLFSCINTVTYWSRFCFLKRKLIIQEKTCSPLIYIQNTPSKHAYIYIYHLIAGKGTLPICIYKRSCRYGCITEKKNNQINKYTLGIGFI